MPDGQNHDVDYISYGSSLVLSLIYVHMYRTAQIFDGGNIDEFDEFPPIC